jgi:hypothetical protein
MGKEGLEPSPVFTERILSPQRLPFRHIPFKIITFIISNDNKIKNNNLLFILYKIKLNKNLINKISLMYITYLFIYKVIPSAACHYQK